MKDFMKEVNTKAVEDQDKAIEVYCEKLESIVYDAIKEITIVIPAASINVQGSPSAQSNLVPIILENVIQ